jgi:hypothetical protein
MPERTGARWGWIAGGVTLAGIAAAALVWMATAPRRPGGPGTAAPLAPDAPLSAITEGLARGDGMALALFVERLAPAEAGAEAPEAMPDADAPAWNAALVALRGGFPRFSPYGRASAVAASARLLQRYGVDPAPPEWIDALAPCFEILVGALGDAEALVRLATLREISGLWTWSPGRDDLSGGALDYLVAWKEQLHASAARALGDQDPKVRAGAVACLARLPLDDKAAPAVAYLKDRDPDVRRQVLLGFAGRPALLDAETILPHVYDPVAGVAEAAESALKARGLTAEQIGLGKLVVHPLPKMRASAVAMIGRRADIDPVVWLLFLSRDKDETVRLKAAEALVGFDTPEARRRLAEMATGDEAAAVRLVAGKAVSTLEADTTAALPPLPGSPSLNPRAN